MKQEVFSQMIRICEAESHIPIAEAMVIQNNNLLGSTNDSGYCTLKNVDIKSKVCIKAFGFIDTCLIIDLKENVVHLKPHPLMLGEVTIASDEVNTKEQFLLFLRYSLSLCNQEDHIRSYRFRLVLTPDSIRTHLKNIMQYKLTVKCL